jgi:hypothetical protein
MKAIAIAQTWARNFVTALVFAAASPALSQQLSPQEAVTFVAGKWWKFSCPHGVTGEGFVRGDSGCVVVKVRSSQPLLDVGLTILSGGRDNFSALPAGTIIVRRTSNDVPTSICGASWLGLGILDTCFTVHKVSDDHFIGYRTSRPNDTCDFQLAKAPATSLLPSREESQCSVVP